MKYETIYPIIQDFFKEKENEVNSGISDNICLSPYSNTCGPDILSITLVAEIKDKKEIHRDLQTYWSQWDNRNTKFGGKKEGFRISECFDNKEKLNNFDTDIKGWIATIYGQLRYYTLAAKLRDGWLIVESSENNREKIDKLKKALKFLKEEGKIKCYSVATYKNLTCSRVWFK